MISALSGGGALSLLSIFGRSPAASAITEARAAARSPAGPPPPLPEGNGASAQSIFEALFGQDAGRGLEEAFTRLDRDGNGGLTAAEVGRAFQTEAPQVDALIARLDQDQDAALSASELQAGLQDLARRPVHTPSAGELAASLVQGLGSPKPAQPTLQEMLFGLLLERSATG